MLEAARRWSRAVRSTAVRSPSDVPAERGLPMSNAASRGRPPSIAGLGREVRAVARQGQLIAAARGRVLPRVPGERVVVFLHGFMAAGPIFDPMRAFVEERAPGVVGTIDLTYGPFERFESVAARLARVVQSASEGRRVDLVGHSLGGIVARWYLQELGGFEHVDRLVTLASPHAGTQAARLAVTPLLRAIHPESTILRTLREGRLRASRVLHTAVVAGADRMITPPESAAAIEDAEVCWVDDLGHNEMLFDARVFEHVQRGLMRPTGVLDPEVAHGSALGARTGATGAGVSTGVLDPEVAHGSALGARTGATGAGEPITDRR